MKTLPGRPKWIFYFLEVVWESLFKCILLCGFCSGKRKAAGISILPGGQPSPARPRQGGFCTHPPPPSLCPYWENPGFLCQEPSQPVKKSWSLWYPLWMNYLLGFLNVVSVAWLRDRGNIILWDLEESESRLGRSCALEKSKPSPERRLSCLRDEPFVSFFSPPLSLLVSFHFISSSLSV